MFSVKFLQHFTIFLIFQHDFIHPANLFTLCFYKNFKTPCQNNFFRL